jgi:1-pyrroline-5-carboxylate dehydrogenase
LWAKQKEQLIEQVNQLTMGNVAEDLSLFMGAVIDDRAFAKQEAALSRAKATDSITVLAGGTTDGNDGYFVRPTILLSTDPGDEIFTTEYFGPILAVHVYPDDEYEAVINQAKDAVPYALTGSILATDRQAIAQATDTLRYSAGNFYINDKPTGAVVGQQPFGGARASGTDDKAGSVFNLIRWVSARTIKELFVPPTDYRYPHMG